jgi:predicted DNA-binding transcriptional regulator AlpA
MQEENNMSELNGTLPADRLLSRAEVEVNFGLSRRFLEVHAVTGDGPPMVKIGRTVRYRVSDLREWVESCRVMSTSENPVRNV